MARVIVSSGHTSDNPGVVAYGLREYDLARKIAKYSLKYIRQAGIISLSTPPNLDLAQRIAWINNTGYNAGSNDITIEIHINDGGKRGIEGWYERDGNNPSQNLTNKLIESICQDMNLPSQGAKSEFQHEMGSISFLSEVSPIACVIECCYIDNAEDAMILGSEFNLEKIGRGIAKGVIDYFGLNLELPEVVGVAQNIQGVGQQQVQGVINQPNQPYQSQINTQGGQVGQTQTYPNQQPQMNGQQVGQTQQYYPTQQTVQPTGQPINQPAQVQQPYNQTPISANQQLQQYQNYQTPAYQAPNSNSATSSSTYQSSGSVSSSSSPSKAGFLPREERKEMIIKNYAKILGREPNDNDLNYFLNTGIREDELLKKMVDSQEHADLVKARQEVITAKLKMTNEQNELMTLRSKVAESDTIINGLNASIAQKNEALTLLNKRIKELEQLNNSSSSQAKRSPEEPKKKYKGNLSDRVFKAFSDILE